MILSWLPAAIGVLPQTEKEALESRILIAELDYRNYSPEIDPDTDTQSSVFAFPPKVAESIAEFQRDNTRAIQALTFPQTCRDVFAQARMLGREEAEWVASFMVALDGGEIIDLDPEMTLAPRVAAAAVLLDACA